MKKEYSEIPVSREAAAGAAVYTKFILLFYDLLVMGFENRFVWKCPTRRIVDFYNRHLSPRHLDVGVGTGYFLDKSTFPNGTPLLHLMDLNPNSLEKTSRRMRRYAPVAHLWNVLEPVREELPQFESIALSNILHCLPGDMRSKAAVFHNLLGLLSEGGTLFGLTILGKGVRAGWLYALFNGLYNRFAFFANRQDGREELEAVLRSHFSDYTLEVVGSVALFSGKK